MFSGNLQHLCQALASENGADESRRGGRFGLVGARSDLGAVMDLSHCGALIHKRRFCRAPVMATFPVTIQHEKLRLVVNARVARKQRVPGIGVVLGLEFLEITPMQRETIKEIITCCRHWSVLPGSSEAA